VSLRTATGSASLSAGASLAYWAATSFTLTMMAADPSSRCGSINELKAAQPVGDWDFVVPRDMGR
jgi:hypothetical protein